jgi:Zn-dependent M28 family amino/carboxypeptidase
VLAMLPATGDSGVTPDKPWLMIGAHYDHLGRGVGGNSLARDGETGEVHNGADDNASGVAANLVAAAQLAGMERERAVLVAFWSGEEMGLLGANAFVRSEIVPMETLAAYINFDMVGRSHDNKVAIQAVGSSSVWPGLIERSNVPVGFDLELQEDPFVPTDSAAFNTAEVPTITFFTGSHEDYHRPTDDADLINYEDLERIAHLGALIAQKVANLDASPDFVVVEQTAPAGDRDSVRAFTGTIPDYASNVEGLLLGGVIEGGPAEEAGLKGGDVIIEFAGQTITNIYDYTYALDAVKVDEPIKVVFMRDGERMETTLTPRARD